MPTTRKVIFANQQFYHVFNRGIDRRPTFTNKREYERAIEAIIFYQFVKPPIRLSKYLTLPTAAREAIMHSLQKNHPHLCEIISFCLMPNHFHFLLKQKVYKGIPTFTSNFTNSYSKYFNVRHQRIGPVFQGIFKAVLVETDEQLIHLSRYIHLNPVTSYIIKPEELENYLWSSYQEYIKTATKQLSSPDIVLNQFPSREAYKKFVLDQVNYARELEKIKHLTFE